MFSRNSSISKYSKPEDEESDKGGFYEKEFDNDDEETQAINRASILDLLKDFLMLGGFYQQFRAHAILPRRSVGLIEISFPSANGRQAALQTILQPLLNRNIAELLCHLFVLKMKCIWAPNTDLNRGLLSRSRACFDLYNYLDCKGCLLSLDLPLPHSILVSIAQQIGENGLSREENISITTPSYSKIVDALVSKTLPTLYNVRYLRYMNTFLQKLKRTKLEGPPLCPLLRYLFLNLILEARLHNTEPKRYSSVFSHNLNLSHCFHFYGDRSEELVTTFIQDFKLIKSFGNCPPSFSDVIQFELLKLSRTGIQFFQNSDNLTVEIKIIIFLLNLPERSTVGHVAFHFLEEFLKIPSSTIGATIPATGSY
ncbi:hypothetical protein CONCODRAFT_9136 [Conidiobolus coronatus NRRL 28638]|uniref:Uncharacterized protein n=1 Tax=Conidiobolus coronatus (strain ATCC 28846 / CBS 209.66 / NRRL 28638) TaxID=796925 RepID=A0A137P0H3_CONC2|nr:hypothetical protein CONCODRAFT_9136 [Conidiobolus coronatus NRRL 28638]|eukprot:KXN68545.1 hypothetical protein CONCODRAFT_9136 [Conidiobolus coronatus NRRL 28638]